MFRLVTGLLAGLLIGTAGGAALAFWFASSTRAVGP